MQAIVQDTYGAVEVLSHGTLTPEIGEGEVLVRVHAAPIHVGDVIVMTGLPKFARMATECASEEPRPGTDIAGRSRRSAGRKGLRPGDEVLGGARALAEYASREDHFALKPANLTSSRPQPSGVRDSALQLLRDVDVSSPATRS
jgi:NADPH:quinone reductase-like Zn-dependent oxidoreductase